MTKERYKQLREQLAEIIAELDAPIKEQYPESWDTPGNVNDIVSGLYGAINYLDWGYEHFVEFEG